MKGETHHTHASTTPTLSCAVRRREAEGFCNACYDRQDSGVVISVYLNELTFRLCCTCARKLQKQLAGILTPGRAP